MLPGKRGNSGSSSSEGRQVMIDEKKRKRMISNRESARRSRMKREQHLKDLNNEIVHLTSNNNQIIHKICEIEEKNKVFELDNSVLRGQSEELRKRLEYAEMVYSYYMHGANSHSMVDHPKEPWIKPWQPHVPILTSAGLRH